MNKITYIKNLLDQIIKIAGLESELILLQKDQPIFLEKINGQIIFSIKRQRLLFELYQLNTILLTASL